MAYPRQGTWLRKMNQETLAASRLGEERECERLRAMWNAAKFSMKAHIREEYRKAFPKGAWSLTAARQSGAMVRIQRQVKTTLDLFGHSAAPYMAEAFNSAKRERVMRLAWMLDMTSPKMVRPKVAGQRLKLREASANASGMVNVYTGAEAEATWLQRFGEWLNAYERTLYTNIELGAINGSTPDDAAQEVEVARPGNRAVDFWDRIDTLFRTTRLAAEAEGAASFMDDNSDMLLEEVWTAQADARVCEDCAALDGDTRAEAEQAGAEPPLHPFCRCYYRIVPKAWSEYLRSLDPEQADALSSRGIAPDAMAVRGDDGKVAALVWVEYKDWLGNVVR